MSSCAEALREEYFPQQGDSIVLWAERPQQLHMENQLGSRLDHLEGRSHATDFRAQILLKAVFNSLQLGQWWIVPCSLFSNISTPTWCLASQVLGLTLGD